MHSLPGESLGENENQDNLAGAAGDAVREIKRASRPFRAFLDNAGTVAFTVMRWEVQRRISNMGATGSDLTRPLWLLGGEGKGAGVGEERPVRRPLQLALPEINQ